ncbi:NAD(P)/FAD-dependent oxidoreductase [Phytomonospora sp. NPDC050363]|uniref:flavin-containing monooxygenase n=1 Tax=Phytomonospora sp. NPDC050363 TaxID=3155642 RepID=UPI0033D722B2
MNDIIVIGGGQAGLAAAHALTVRGHRPLVLDAAAETGEVWRRRWDSLRLFTPARHSALPGMPFPGRPGRYPGKDEVADYLAGYARHFGLAVQHGSTVRRLHRDNGGFVAETDSRAHRAEAVVVATGPFQRPRVPALAERLDPAVRQLHSGEYRAPGRIPGGSVLVVGAGNSGVQIAAELSATHDVALATGRPRPVMPQRVLGRDVFGWLQMLGVVRAPVTGRLGRRVRARDPLIGRGPRDLLRSGVRVLGRLTGVDGRAVHTAAGEVVAPDTVVWATGYAPDYGWLDVAGAVDPVDGRPVQDFGVSPVPGLFHVGLSFQHSRGSALLGWVGRDAELVADRLAAGLRSARPSSATPGRSTRARRRRP